MDPRPGPLDDAAVVRPPGATSSLALTIDVITPIVDDPWAFGAIAAANSMSDVYAMGGKPEIALSFLAFPTDKLPLEVLAEVVRGIEETCARAGCAVVGGHSIVDPEPKAGLAVVGSVDPGRVWSHGAARAGHALVLTKPLGTGFVGQAVRGEKADADLIARAIRQMVALNDVARDVGLELDASSCTDVTGYGLLGHLKHIVEAAGLEARLRASAVPRIEGVAALIEAGLVPGGTRRNLGYAGPITVFDDDVAEPERLLLADAQTSGGLLLCLPSDRAAEAVRELVARGCPDAAVVGELRTPEEGPRIRVSAG